MAMRSRRSVHVRPRPPSDGRPRPRPAIRPAAPLAGRMSSRRPVEPMRRLPLPASLLLAVAILALGGAVLLTGTGLLGDAAGGLGAAFGGVLERLAPPSVTPAPQELVGFGPPTLAVPADRYTNVATADLSGTVPTSMAGTKGVTIRLYRVSSGKPAALLREQAVGATPAFTFSAIPLVTGENDFAATLATSGRESDQSAIVAYILDTVAPTVTISSPRNGAIVAGSAVTISGRTKASSSITARDEANAATAAATAKADGSFKLTIALAPGSNGITIRATDLAGNVGSTVLSLQRSSGQLQVSLVANPYRLSAKAGGTIVLTARATAPDGSAVVGADVTFTITIPGLQPITQDATTDGTGTAVWPTSVPPGAATSGMTGLATVLLTTSTQGAASARAAVTIVP